MIFIGEHFIRHWSSTQSTVALSSGEAELYGVIRGTSEALALQSLAADLGVELSITVHTDSSAAKGISERRGIGKVRHLDVADLWVQDRVRSREITLRKIAGQSNPPDILTKYVERDILEGHLNRLGLRMTSGQGGVMRNSVT